MLSADRPWYLTLTKETPVKQQYLGVWWGRQSSERTPGLWGNLSYTEYRTASPTSPKISCYFKFYSTWRKE